MITFTCHVCRTELSAEAGQEGQLVRCPACRATMRVPVAGATALAPRMAASASRAQGRRYGFNCGYCSSRLEATEAMAGQDGQCPTCGNQITIPILDRYGRLIDPKTQLIIKQDPHPVHAYAAAGDRAPKIIRDADGAQAIVCARCGARSPVTANNCKGCGMPFTMEGTTVELGGASNGFCVSALVLGIIGIPGSCAVLPSVLAIIFGIVGLRQVSRHQGTPGRAMAIAGIICGAIGCLSANFFWYHIL